LWSSTNRTRRVTRGVYTGSATQRSALAPERPWSEGATRSPVALRQRRPTFLPPEIERKFARARILARCRQFAPPAPPSRIQIEQAPGELWYPHISPVPQRSESARKSRNLLRRDFRRLATSNREQRPVRSPEFPLLRLSPPRTREVARAATDVSFCARVYFFHLDPELDWRCMAWLQRMARNSAESPGLEQVKIQRMMPTWPEMSRGPGDSVPGPGELSS
jgi:hypothetical protein